MTKPRTITLCVAAIILGTGVLHLATIRDGHSWGGDFSFYIHHAKNIAEGVDYTDTGFVYNPYYRHLSPDSFPPVFPLMLAPIYKMRGLDLNAMKVEIILTFLAALVILFLVFKSELPGWPVVAMVAVIALNPWFWQFKDEVLSDIPFLLFTYLAILWMRRYHTAHEAGKARLIDAVLAGVFVCAAYGTRSLGLVLVPCVIAHDLLRYRKITRLSAVVTIMFAAALLSQSLLLRSESSYIATMGFSIEAILYRLILDTRPISVLWDNGYAGQPGEMLASLLAMVMVILGMVGYVTRLRKKITLLELFAPMYLLPLMLAPAVYGTRYIMPLIPLNIFYVFVAITEPAVMRDNKLVKPVFITLIVAIMATYAARYTTLDYGPIREGVAKDTSVELFDFIEANTDPNDVIVFRKPRVLSLYTDRPASVYHIVSPLNYDHLWNYIVDIEAKYIISGQPFLEDRGWLNPFIREYGRDVDEIFTNADFAVYRIKQ